MKILFVKEYNKIDNFHVHDFTIKRKYVILENIAMFYLSMVEEIKINSS